MSTEVRKMKIWGRRQGDLFQYEFLQGTDPMVYQKEKIANDEILEVLNGAADRLKDSQECEIIITYRSKKIRKNP